MYLLIEKERTQSVRRNRHRNTTVTQPEVESLPAELLTTSAEIALKEPIPGLATMHVDDEGTTCRRQENQGEQMRPLAVLVRLLAVKLNANVIGKIGKNL